MSAHADCLASPHRISSGSRERTAHRPRRGTTPSLENSTTHSSTASTTEADTSGSFAQSAAGFDFLTQQRFSEGDDDAAARTQEKEMCAAPNGQSGGANTTARGAAAAATTRSPKAASSKSTSLTSSPRAAGTSTPTLSRLRKRVSAVARYQLSPQSSSQLSSGTHEDAKSVIEDLYGINMDWVPATPEPRRNSASPTKTNADAATSGGGGGGSGVVKGASTTATNLAVARRPPMDIHTLASPAASTSPAAAPSAGQHFHNHTTKVPASGPNTAAAATTPEEENANSVSPSPSPFDSPGLLGRGAYGDGIRAADRSVSPPVFVHVEDNFRGLDGTSPAPLLSPPPAPPSESPAQSPTPVAAAPSKAASPPASTSSVVVAAPVQQHRPPVAPAASSSLPAPVAAKSIPVVAVSPKKKTTTAAAVATAAAAASAAAVQPATSNGNGTTARSHITQPPPQPSHTATAAVDVSINGKAKPHGSGGGAEKSLPVAQDAPTHTAETTAASAPVSTARHADPPPPDPSHIQSTPAPRPLPKSRIPPIAPLDGPRRPQPTTPDDHLPPINGAEAAAGQRGGVPFQVYPNTATADTPGAAAPPRKRGSRLNSAFANIGSAAGKLPGLGKPRERVRQVSFKEGDVVALPDSKSLRTPVTSLLIFRNPTMREQGKEMMASPAEVYSQLLQRGTAVCALAVVDEDAMRRPCLVASGFSVRVFEEDKALALGNGRMAHGAMKMLHSFRNRLRRGSSGRNGSAGSAGSDSTSQSSSSPPSNSNTNPTRHNANGNSRGGGGNAIVMVPEKRDRKSKSSDDSTESHNGEFDRFLHKAVFDETLSRPKGENVCDSVTLQLLAQRWAAGQNASLIFGNSSGRSIQCFDVATGVVRDALDKLRSHLKDPASTAELQMHMGDVSTDLGTGRVRVQDLLVCDSDSDSDDSSSGSSHSGDKAAPQTASQAAAEHERRKFPDVRLARSPVMGTFVKGLSVVTARDALSDASCVFKSLGQGFRQYNVSTHTSRNGSFSSRNGSFSSLPSASNGASGSGTNGINSNNVHTCFAVLRLTAICRGKDMRSAPLSAREATSVGEERTTRNKKSKNGAAAAVTHHRTTECVADVVVSTLLITFFGTEFQVLKTIVENKLIAAKQARGGAFVMASEQLTYHPTEWADPVHFLYSLLRDGLGGRTHTVTCLCLSEYDSHATPWLHVMERARAILNMEPNTGNLRNYLVYLLEQYENLNAQQRREKKGLGARRDKDARGGGLLGTHALQPGEVSMYFVQKLVHSLDQYLANPVGEPPLLERLEIKSAEVFPPLAPPAVIAPLQPVAADNAQTEVTGGTNGLS